MLISFHVYFDRHWYTYLTTSIQICIIYNLNDAMIKKNEKNRVWIMRDWAIKACVYLVYDDVDKEWKKNYEDELLKSVSILWHDYQHNGKLIWKIILSVYCVKWLSF